MSAVPPGVPPPPPLLPPERPLVPPSPWRTRVWTVLQLLFVLLPLSLVAMLTLGFSWACFGEVLGGRVRSLTPALGSAFAAVLLLGLDWRLARKAWRVSRGWESPPSLENWTYAAAALGVGGLVVGLAVVKFSEMMRSPNEGATRGNLGAIRSALSIYYGDMEGLYPEDLHSLTVNGKYLQTLPTARTPPYHKESSRVLTAPAPDDTGGWWYRMNPAHDGVNVVFGGNCTHTDNRGSAWTSY